MMPPYTHLLPPVPGHRSTGCADTVLGSYLHVAAPLGLPFQQGIQDSPAGLLGSRVIPTHHVVGRPHSLEKFDIDILTIAVVGNIAQVQVHRWAWRHS